MSSSPNSSSSSEPAAPEGLAALFDVACDVHVLLGSSTLTVRECLSLQRHSVIRLAQSAGADMQVTVNGVAVAAGEVVIIDNSTAIRITDILAPPSSEGHA